MSNDQIKRSRQIQVQANPMTAAGAPASAAKTPGPRAKRRLDTSKENSEGTPKRPKIENDAKPRVVFSACDDDVRAEVSLINA
jgi:hypothetical protein